MSELLSGLSIGKLDFDHRNIDPGDGVSQGNAVMGVGCGGYLFHPGTKSIDNGR
jgi:hypothetical protein